MGVEATLIAVGIAVLLLIALNVIRIREAMREPPDDGDGKFKAASEDGIRLTKEDCFRILEMYDKVTDCKGSSNWSEHQFDDYDELMSDAIKVLRGYSAQSMMVLYPDGKLKAQGKGGDCD